MNLKRNLMIGVAIGTTVFQGCRSEGPQMVGSHSVGAAERNMEAVVLDSSLMSDWMEDLFNEGKLSFEHPVSRRVPGTQLLQVFSEIRNRLSEKDIVVEISTVFRDSSNIIVDETDWEKYKLTPNQTIGYKVNSITPASKFCIRMRMPRRFTNSLSGQGINLMTDKILRSLVKSEPFRQTNGIERIALHQFDNRTNEKLDESLFTSKLRAETNEKIPGRVRFVSRRFEVLDAVEEERRKKRDGDLTVKKENIKKRMSGVGYFLTGKLQALPDREQYRLFSFQLIDAENSDIIWEGQFEIGDF